MSTEHAHAHQASIVHRALVGLVGAVIRQPWLVLGAAAALMVASGLLAASRMSFLTQRDDLVSPHKDYQQRYRQYIEEFGDDDDMVVVVKGTDRQQMIAALERLAARLEKQPEHFDRIFYKVDLRSLRNRALLYLPADQIRSIQDNLRSMSLLLEPPLIAGFDPLFSWKSLTLSQLLGEAERRSFNQADRGKPRPADEQFYQQLAAIADAAALVLEKPDGYRNPWHSILPAKQSEQDLMAEPQYFFSGDGKLAFLLVRPRKDLSSFTSAQASIDAMHRQLDRLRAEYPDLNIGLTGLPVLENDEINASSGDTATASWLALAGVALLYLIVYRRPRYPLLTMTTLLVGIVLTFGWLTLTVGHLNILSATFGVMLIGLGDYGVLWVTRFDQERAAGLEVADAMRATALSVGPSIVTAALTTAFAFFTSLLVDFRAVRELGWIAGSGVLFCALACFTVLPALLKLTEGKKIPLANGSSPAPAGAANGAEKPIIPLPQAASWLPALNRRPRWVLAAAALVIVAGGFFATRVQYDHNLLHLQARGLESVKWELTLIEHTAGASWHALSSTTTPEEALALKARYEKLPSVSRVVEVASLIPREQELKIELLKDIHSRLRRLPARGALIPHPRPNPELLVQKIDSVLEGLSPKTTVGAAQQLCANLRKLRQRLQTADAQTAADRLEKFELYLTRDLAEDLHQLRDVSAPQFISTADLPQSLRERYVGKSGKWLLRVFGTGSLWEFDHLRDFVHDIRRVDPDVTGKPIQTLEGLVSLQSGFLWGCVYAFCAMVTFLLLDFRNLWHAVLALLPLLAGLVVALGVLGLVGFPLNPANLIALPLILGVGADNGVHVVHDYLSRRKNGCYTLSSSTGRGIFVAALTTVLGFGTLMISHHRGLYGLGLLLTIGISCCLTAALVFLPALLRVITERSARAAERKTLPLPQKAA